MRRVPASVRELIQKIENHPDRHALQPDLRQNQAKKMIQDVGNIELFELECWHRLLHMRALLAERNRGQSKIRFLYDGPSFTPRVCHQEGKTSWPGDKEYHLANQLKKKCKKKKFQGIMTDSYEIMNCVSE